MKARRVPGKADPTPRRLFPPRLDVWRRKARVARKITLIAAAAALGAPLQLAFLRLWPGGARALPLLFHRYALAVMGVRRDVRGDSRGGALLVSNHVSWLDIVVLSACRPMTFVGKSDIAGWPVFGTLARLQETLFVVRERRMGAADDANETARRVGAGQGVTLFAEGTSSDGSDVLPFRSALLAGAEGANVPVQSVAIAYLARDGEPLDAQGRRDVAWYADKLLAPHLLEIFALKSLEVRVEFGRAAVPDPQETRKALARRLESEVRARVAAALRE